MKDEFLFDLKNGGAHCPYPVLYSARVRGRQKTAQDADCLRQLVHKELVIRPQSLNACLGFAQSRRECLCGRNTAYAIYDRREKMKMFRANMNCQARPEQIQPVMADQDIAGIQSLHKLAQHFIQGGVIVG